ncbi:hypothetical protein [Kribbella sp. DT2]|uniref:hypothetical protein n=1 Tax=Kribbella sp. DT2 TaxID=3393427 RepID=UPI003CE8C513
MRRDEAEAELLAQRDTDLLRHKHAQDIEIIEGREKAHERTEQFQPRKSVCAFILTTKADSFGAPEDSPDRTHLERGVKYRNIYLTAALSAPRVTEYWHWLRTYSAGIRVVPTLPMRLIIVDGEAVVMALDPDDHARGIVVHHSRSAVLLATELFESYWARGELPPQLRDEAAPAAEISAQESAFFALLVQGATDDQAGRKLGVSLRTVRRMAAKLGEQVGASGRFELGVRAAQWGWVR